MFEECGLPYRVVLTDIAQRQQDVAGSWAISPNCRAPAIFHRLERSQWVFESGAILVYLAEKTGRFLPAVGSGRMQAREWLFCIWAALPDASQAAYFPTLPCRGERTDIDTLRIALAADCAAWQAAEAHEKLVRFTPPLKIAR